MGGTALVAERGIVENLRSRTFKVITALLLSSIAAVTIPQALSGAGTTYTIATIGKAPAQVAAALDAAGKSADFTVKYVSRADGPAVRRAVREGDATAGLAGGTLYTSATSAGTFPVVVAQTVVALETSRRLSETGLSPRQIADLQSIRPPKQVIVGRADNAGRAWLRASTHHSRPPRGESPDKEGLARPSVRGALWIQLDRGQGGA